MHKVVPVKLNLSPQTKNKLKEEFGTPFDITIQEMLEDYLENTEMLFNINFDITDNSINLIPVTFNSYVLIKNKNLILSNGYLKNEQKSTP